MNFEKKKLCSKKYTKIRKFASTDDFFLHTWNVLKIIDKSLV